MIQLGAAIRKHLLISTMLLGLGGCGAWNDMTPRTLVGDGHHPMVPIASDETIVIGYRLPSDSARSAIITIAPDGKVRYEVSGDPPGPDRTILVKQIAPAGFAELKRRLEIFRPPEEPEPLEKPSYKAGDELNFLPVGCSWIWDGSFEGGLIFTRRGKGDRWLSIQTGCKTGAANRLLGRFKAIVNEAPINARSLGLAYAS